MSIKKSLPTLKTISSAVVALTLISPLANAANYTLTGGLTNVHSTTFNTDVGVSPRPSGIDSGTVDVNVNTSTGEVSFSSGANIVLSDFTGSISFLGTTRFDAVGTAVTTNVGVSGTLDSSRSVHMTSVSASPAVSVDPTFTNCSGIACAFLGLVDLNLSTYSVDIQFNANFTSFTGTLNGVTSNGSTMEMQITGIR